MIGGLVGKILKVDLTTKSISTIDTSKYEQWVGGHGIAVAVFWDEVDKDYIFDTHDKTAFEPENVMVIMSGPLQGTLAPNGGRCDVHGIASSSYPRPQWSRSNFGGRFAPMMKFAGYDGIVIKGASDKPVWINVIDDKVTIEDAADLWGLDTFETQEEIWNKVAGDMKYGEWIDLGEASTTQRPAVLCIGPAGENLARVGILLHEGGWAVGQGGFGGVWGSKKLKAISVHGTGSVPIARPKDLFATRAWYDEYSVKSSPGAATGFRPFSKENFGRAYNCFGCDRSCGGSPSNPFGPLVGTQDICVEANAFKPWQMFTHIHQQAGFLGYEEPDIPQPDRPNQPERENVVIPATDLQRLGIDAYLQFSAGIAWLLTLHRRGIVGKGPQYKVQTDLDFDSLTSEDWSTAFQNFGVDLLKRVAYRQDIGDDLAEGVLFAAEKWGVLEEDLLSGVINQIYWIGEVHWGIYIDWAYASILGSRDLNMHFVRGLLGNKNVTIEQRAKRMAELTPPWHDELMIDYSENSIYTEHMARLVAFNLRYENFFVGSCLFCDWNRPVWTVETSPGKWGLMPEYEERFINAVTGLDLTYAQGMDIGRKINNFDRAIWVMNGRHRDEEYFPPFPPYKSYVHTDKQPYLQNHRLAHGKQPGIYPVYKNGEWVEEECVFPLSNDKMDEFKTIFYEQEGWDPDTGWPTRTTLEADGLGYVADELERRGRLGKE